MSKETAYVIMGAVKMLLRAYGVKHKAGAAIRTCEMSLEYRQN